MTEKTDRDMRDELSAKLFAQFIEEETFQDALDLNSEQIAHRAVCAFQLANAFMRTRNDVLEGKLK
jgi:hypothetical protein